jgi:C1A family cysteine protease
VSSVKDQGYDCGSCYAFATAGDIESSYLIKYGKKYDLSEQQIVDCSTSHGNRGCLTGFYQYSLKYVIKNGITLEQYYPYTGRASTCKTKITNTLSISSYYSYDGNSCSVLESALKSRPVLASVDGINQIWQFYTSGILNQCGTRNILNHAVQVIGFSSFKNGTSYYVVKNSWGTDWGEGGKIRIDRNVQNGNLCLICSYIYYSII